MYLAIDTSTNWAGVALAAVSEGDSPGREKELIAEIGWSTEQNHSVELLPNLIYLFKQARREISRLKGLCVSLGHGSFKGLRVGLSTAKGLAYGLKIPLVGISTLEAEAYPFRHSRLDICPLHGAGRGELAAALFRTLRGRWIKLMEEQIIAPEKLIGHIKRPTLFCGEIPDNIEQLLKEKLEAQAIFAPSIIRARRPGNVLYLGLERLLKGESDDPAILQPLYLRRPPITISKKAKFGSFSMESI